MFYLSLIHIFIDDKGNTIPEQSETFDLSLVSSSFKGENNLIYLDGQSLLFSTPIYDEKGISKVLIGIRDKENIQNLIKPKSFNGQGLSCIIDQNGNVVISPTDLKPFMQLDNIFKDGTDTDAVNHIKNCLLYTSCKIIMIPAPPNQPLPLY